MSGSLLSTAIWLIVFTAVPPCGAPESSVARRGNLRPVDRAGYRFERTPERIVSLNPDLTENVIALGAGDRLVGVSDFCPLPSAGTAVRLGGLQNPGLERILSLRPDLVLATREGNSPETVARLRTLGVEVCVFEEARDFTAYFSFLRDLGALLGREEAAAGRIGEMEAAIERVRSGPLPPEPVSVFVQIGLQPLITASRGTLIGEMVEIASGQNIAASLPARYPVFSREQVLIDDPEVIIVAAMGSEAAASAAFWERFSELRAVKKGRVHILDPDTVCRLGPRLVEGLERIAGFLAGGRGE